KSSRPKESSNLLRFQSSDYPTFPRRADPSKGPAFNHKAEFVHEGMTRSVGRSELGGNFRGTAYTAKPRDKEQAIIRKTPQSMPATPRVSGASRKPLDKVQSGLPVVRSPAVSANSYSHSQQNKGGEEPAFDTVPTHHPVTTES
ncbi:hypothetical protein X801_08214, partial [Opisthorchis viverrini]